MAMLAACRAYLARFPRGGYLSGLFLGGSQAFGEGELQIARGQAGAREGEESRLALAVIRALEMLPNERARGHAMARLDVSNVVAPKNTRIAGRRVRKAS